VSRLLVGHELDVRAVLSREASVEEVLLREDGNTVVEEIELDPFLVKTESDRLEVEVRLDLVTRKSTIGSETTSWGVRSRLRLGQLAVGVVVGGGRVKRESRNGGSSRAAHERTSGGRCARVRSMAGRTSDLVAADGVSSLSGDLAPGDLAVRSELGDSRCGSRGGSDGGGTCNNAGEESGVGAAKRGETSCVGWVREVGETTLTAPARTGSRKTTSRALRSTPSSRSSGNQRGHKGGGSHGLLHGRHLDIEDET